MNDTVSIQRLAEEIGFSHVAPVCMEAMVPLEEIRRMCAADRCKNYNQSWSCPPAPIVENLERTGKRIRGFAQGILVQTTGQMKDAFDLEVIQQAEQEQKRKFDTLVRQVRRLGIFCMPFASGACSRCYECTYPDRPCRYPDKLYPSMEAYGLWVGDVCSRSGLPYNYGPNTITYTACLLWGRKESQEI